MELISPADDVAGRSSEIRVETVSPRLGLGETLAAYLDLTKPRITFLIVLSALAGFALGSSSPINWVLLFHTVFGIGLLCSGIGALNQYWERDLDALMLRTQRRPLPSGKLNARQALWFGIALALLAEVYLFRFVNPLTAAWGLGAFGSYLFLYTPLKTRTSWCTFIGAFPGALPPLLGWTAAHNSLGVEAAALFGILFFWQFPHFHAISTMYREDYARAGIRMLPVVETDGKSTAREIIGYTIALVLVSLLPTILGLTGWIYLAGAIILGAAFLYVSFSTARQMSRDQARKLLKFSVLYLPLLLSLMVLDK